MVCQAASRAHSHVLQGQPVCVGANTSLQTACFVGASSQPEVLLAQAEMPIPEDELEETDDFTPDMTSTVGMTENNGIKRAAGMESRLPNLDVQFKKAAKMIGMFAMDNPSDDRDSVSYESKWREAERRRGNRVGLRASMRHTANALGGTFTRTSKRDASKPDNTMSLLMNALPPSRLHNEVEDVDNFGDRVHSTESQ